MKFIVDPEWGQHIIDNNDEPVALFIHAADARYAVAAMQACHRLGLTAEELEAGKLENAIRLSRNE